MSDGQMLSATITARIDLGDRYSESCLLDVDGTVVENGRLAERLARSSGISQGALPCEWR